MEYIKAKDFRTFTDFTVKNIYAPYRSGGVEINGKFVGRTFKFIDNKLKERIWNKEDKVFETKDIDIKINAEFFEIYRKVFDVVIESGGEEKTVKALGSFKIKEMIRADFDTTIPMIKKDDGTDAEAFDWEDGLYKGIIGNKYKMKVTGTGLKTAYLIKLVSKTEPKKEEAPDAGWDFEIK